MFVTEYYTEGITNDPTENQQPLQDITKLRFVLKLVTTQFKHI